MANGRLLPPNLDDRTWQDIVNHVRALIPQYTPQWTDHNPSDLGITVVELFAWLVEGMIYRLNRVPEKHYIELLNLLGITRDPATPANAFVTFTVTNAPTTVVPKGTKVSTLQTPTEDPVVLETDEQLIALPINLSHLMRAFLAGKFAISYTNHSVALVGGPLANTTFIVGAGHADTIFLGFDNPSTQPLRISFDFGQTAPDAAVQLEWTYSQGTLHPFTWPTVVPSDDGTEAFTRSGQVVLNVPAGWQTQAPGTWALIQPQSPAHLVADSRFWLGLRVGNLTGSPLTLTLRRVGFNSVQATNALTVNVNETNAEAEPLGTSNGKAFQSFALRNTPLFEQPNTQTPYGHLIIQVREPIGGGAFGPWTGWTVVDDFPPGNASVFRSNPVTGDIFFGNHDAVTGVGNGKIPPQGSEIRALTYRYTVGSVRGNVPPHTVKVLRDPHPGLIKVINPGSATGGSEQEAIEDTKRRAPEVLKNRDRAVATTDYEYLAREASTDIRKVRALPPRLHETTVGPYVAGTPWLFGGLDRSAGRVNVIVVPDAPEPLTHPAPQPRPRPEEALLVETADHLNPRRPDTTHVHVTGPRYLPIRVVAAIKVWQSAIDDGLVEDPATSTSFRDSIVDQLKRYLHPTRGKPNSSGWEVGERIYVNDVFAFIQPAVEVGFIESIELVAATPDYGPHPVQRPPGYDLYDQGTWIFVADYELVSYGGAPADITVQAI